MQDADIVQYVVSFPPGEKYVSLLVQPEGAEDRARVEGERARLRAKVRDLMAERAATVAKQRGKAGSGSGVIVTPDAAGAVLDVDPDEIDMIVFDGPPAIAAAVKDTKRSAASAAGGQTAEAAARPTGAARDPVKSKGIAKQIVAAGAAAGVVPDGTAAVDRGAAWHRKGAAASTAGQVCGLHLHSWFHSTQHTSRVLSSLVQKRIRVNCAARCAAIEGCPPQHPLFSYVCMHHLPVWLCAGGFFSPSSGRAASAG